MEKTQRVDREGRGWEGRHSWYAPNSQPHLTRPPTNQSPSTTTATATTAAAMAAPPLSPQAQTRQWQRWQQQQRWLHLPSSPYTTTVMAMAMTAAAATAPPPLALHAQRLVCTSSVCTIYLIMQLMSYICSSSGTVQREACSSGVRGRTLTSL